MAPPPWIASIRAVTFDCYGTLVDWEAGIAAYVRPRLERAARAGRLVSESEWLARWEPIQFALLTPYRPYREVLATSFEQTMRAFELEVFADGGPGLARSIGEWPPFDDTVPSLRRIARRRSVGIVSNIDRDLVAETLGRLLVPLALVATAEDVGAYKPDPRPLELALTRLGLPPGEVLHAGFGWRYDLAPARALGMRACWVNRGGGPLPDGAEADLVVNSLAELADLLDPR
jgi:2-haloalkanoic acid dehalogenase type II